MKHMEEYRDLYRQLQEAWDENDSLERAYDIMCEQVRHEEGNHNYTRGQLHRVARERDQERELRMVAEEWHTEIMSDTINQLLDAIVEEHDSRLAADAALADVLEEKTMGHYVESCTRDHSTGIVLHTIRCLHDVDCPQYNEEE